MICCVFVCFAGVSINVSSLVIIFSDLWSITPVVVAVC